MNTCKKYNVLRPEWKTQVEKLIKKMCGKSHIADISIEDSELYFYEFKVTVCKYNTVKGWATIGYIRHDVFKGDVWRLTYQPRMLKSEMEKAGKTGSYS